MQGYIHKSSHQFYSLLHSNYNVFYLKRLIKLILRRCLTAGRQSAEKPIQSLTFANRYRKKLETFKTSIRTNLDTVFIKVS